MLIFENFCDVARQRDLYLREHDNNNIYYLPQGWIDEFDDWDEEDGILTYCYAPTHNRPNSPVDTLWIPIDDLKHLDEVSAEAAAKLHPNLFVFLHAIDNEVDVSAWKNFWENRGERIDL